MASRKVRKAPAAEVPPRGVAQLQRSWTCQTLLPPPSPHLPIPDGAVWAEWQDPGTPKAFRYFEGSRWTVERDERANYSQDVEVYIRGTQELDGAVKREICVNQLHPDTPITPSQAAQLASILIKAVMEIEGPRFKEIDAAEGRHGGLSPDDLGKLALRWPWSGTESP
jgi:hypothetical protein